MARSSSKSKNEFDEVEHKLLILYLLENMGIPTPSDVIEELILDANYMDYFKLNACLADLQERYFVEKFSSNNISRFYITNDGRKLLKTLETQLPLVVRSKINNFIEKNKKNIRHSMEVSAQIHEDNNSNEYIVKCKACDDNHMLMELNISTPSHKEARTIRHNWLNNLSVVYEKIINEVSKDIK